MATRRALGLVAALLVTGAAGCTAQITTGESDAGQPGAPPDLAWVMAPPDCGVLSICGRQCANLQDDPQSCGACDRTCVIPNAVAGCGRGECVVAACTEGFFDVDKKIANGCEAMSDCVKGSACTTKCDSTGVTACTDGVAECVPPAETCNGADDNCDGRCDEGALRGCRIPVHRSLGGGGHLYTSDLAAAKAAPFVLEAEAYFQIYRLEAPTSRPVYLCRKPNGKFLLTTSVDCEALKVAGTLLGYWLGAARCDAIPLFRLHHAGAGDHFYTVSAQERDNAVRQFGYGDEGIAGWVFATP